MSGRRRSSQRVTNTVARARKACVADASPTDETTSRPEESPPRDAGETGTLTVEQEKALERLLTGDSISDAATAAGVSRETASRWVNGHQVPAFRATLLRRRAEMTDLVRERLRAVGMEFVNVLHTLATDAAMDGKVRVMAARAGLELGVKLGCGREESPKPADPPPAPPQSPPLHGAADADPGSRGVLAPGFRL